MDDKRETFKVNKYYYTDWLNMIYPRLKLAKDLLSAEGVIFISIDDNEQENLKKSCDEVFGGQNFVAQLIWERAFSPKNDARFISNSHDYVLMYVKNINNFQMGRLPRTAEANARYSNPDNDPRGVWMSSDMADKKKKDMITRSSAAEYLTFVASAGESDISFEMRYEDENIWLSQKMMAVLYDVSVSAINQHIKKIFDDGELSKDAVIKKYLITAEDGKSYNTIHYNLQMIIAVGFKVNNQRAVQFRKWAGQIVKDHTIQGWTMDVDRLKKGHTFTDEYFDRQLQQIREIRLSERKFYQKVTDLYETAFDYDRDSNITRLFFQTVQNKMHYAVHRHTAAELIYKRADADKEHMGMTTWENAPDGKILKADVSIAKNYLSEKEMRYLERIVSLYLDYAELQAERKIPMSMEDWAKRLDGFLEFNGDEILTGPGKISAEKAKLHAESEYEKYRIIQDRLYESDFDRFFTLEQEVKRKDEV